MKTTTTALGVLALTATAATAGGIERSIIGPGILFEKGDYVELSFGNVPPSISGVSAIPVGPLPAGQPSGDMASNYSTLSLGFKKELSDRVSLGFLLNNPVGAKVNYAAGTTYIYSGSNAEVSSTALTVMMKYQATDNISVYGGLTGQRAKGNVTLFNGYRMSTSSELDFGYLLGAAYEKPEIALRVALTYTSGITHDFTATELTALGPLTTTFESEVPQALTLDFQTGVAKDTLVFGSVRWRDWTAFDITPAAFAAGGGGSLVSYDNDSTTYTLGLGRKFTDSLSGAVFVAHEAGNGGFAGNLGPTDGYTSLGLGLTYTRDNMKITGGVSYAKLGNAKTQAPAALGAPAGTTLGEFKDNDLIGVGVKVGFSF